MVVCSAGHVKSPRRTEAVNLFSLPWRRDIVLVSCLRAHRSGQMSVARGMSLTGPVNEECSAGRVTPLIDA